MPSSSSSAGSSHHLNHRAASLPARSSATSSPANSGEERRSTSPIITSPQDSQAYQSSSGENRGLSVDVTGGNSPIVYLSYYETPPSSNDADELTMRPASAPNSHQAKHLVVARSKSAPAEIGR